MNTKRLAILASVTFFISAITESIVQACTITLINDSQNAVLIALKNIKKTKNKQTTTTVRSSKKITVEPGKATTFGDDTQHTCFDVYVAEQVMGYQKPTSYNRTQKRVYSPTYNRLCTIAQHSCNMGKKIQVKVSDIPDRVDHTLFSVKMYQKK